MTFINNRDIALTDEFNPTISFGGNLYISSIPDITMTRYEKAIPLNSFQIIQKENDTWSIPAYFNFPVKLFNVNGQLLNTFYNNSQNLSWSEFPTGLYLLRDNFNHILRLQLI